MNEEQWLNSTDPVPMLEFLRMSGRTSDRKLRLFACACLRNLWPCLVEGRSRKVVKIAEQYADGVVSASKLASCLGSAEGARKAIRSRFGDSPQLAAATSVLRLAFAPYEDAVEVANAAARVADSWEGQRPAQVTLLRDLFGSPFRLPLVIDTGWLAWNDGTLGRLAQAAYDDRLLPSGHLDSDRLAVLADALEDAGLTDDEMLGHLRGPGPHVRGCWAVDAILKRE